MKNKGSFVSVVLIVIGILMYLSTEYIGVGRYEVAVKPMLMDGSLILLLLAIFIQVFILNIKFDNYINNIKIK